MSGTVQCECGGSMAAVEQVGGGETYQRQPVECESCGSDGKVLIAADGSAYLFGSAKRLFPGEKPTREAE